MWLFLPCGFFSVVAHRDSFECDAEEGGIPTATQVIVRCRERGPLEYFQHACRPDGVVIEVNPAADYPFRATVPTVLWSEFLADQGASIMATNFKTAATQERGSTDPYVGALHRVWAVLNDALSYLRPRPPARVTKDGNFGCVTWPPFSAEADGVDGGAPGDEQLGLRYHRQTRPQRRNLSLNGGQTHALSAVGRAQLERLLAGPLPRTNVNPGVIDRLTRGSSPLAEVVQLPSPFKKDRRQDGSVQPCSHLRITDVGRQWLADQETP